MPAARKRNADRPEARPRPSAWEAHPRMHEIIALFLISSGDRVPYAACLVKGERAEVVVVNLHAHNKL